MSEVGPVASTCSSKARRATLTAAKYAFRPDSALYSSLSRLSSASAEASFEAAESCAGTGLRGAGRRDAGAATAAVVPATIAIASHRRARPGDLPLRTATCSSMALVPRVVSRGPGRSRREIAVYAYGVCDGVLGCRRR